ncbi:MAG: haloacid dehalogenase-like hydrolase [Erysipelotrichaceae bacterium]|nr:haloacid dehalogenase-like hydrolase [Erysipelotrichaceae bacterium]
MNKPIIAIIYDFDKTLCDQDMQNYSFIPNLNMTPEEFWNEIGEFSKSENMEGILSYLYYMVKKSKEKGKPVTKQYLKTLGNDVILYPGVSEWFDRINQYGKDNGAIIEHYIISSGIKDIIASTSIAKYFKAIFACDFYYDDSGEAIWPKIAINFTGKTQYIYKINKGIFDDADSTEVNKKYKEKRIPFHNMIYIGDGLTDIPCMTMLKKQGGKSIGIYVSKSKEKVQQFLVDDRVNYVCPANYRENSYLDRTVKLIIKSTCLVSELAALEEKQTLEAEIKLQKSLED